MGNRLQAPAATAFVVGDIMVDIVVEPLGALNPGSDTRSRITLTPGGSAANFAVAMAHSTPGRPGEHLEVHLVGAVGDDPLAEMAARSLRAAGVITHLVVAPGATTGTVVAVIGPGGERTMLTDRGANHHLVTAVDAAGVDAAGVDGAGVDGAGVDGAGALATSVPAGTTHLHLSGYLLLDATSRPAGESLLAAARADGIATSVDACSAGPLAELGPGAFLDLVAGVDIFFANRQEAAVLTSEEDPLAMTARLRRLFPEVLLTLGAEGIAYSGVSASTLQLPAHPARQVADTAGAGDALTGTFLGRRLVGDTVEEALQSALAAAASAVSRTGARSSI